MLFQIYFKVFKKLVFHTIFGYKTAFQVSTYLSQIIFKWIYLNQLILAIQGTCGELNVNPLLKVSGVLLDLSTYLTEFDMKPSYKNKVILK